MKAKEAEEAGEEGENEEKVEGEKADKEVGTGPESTAEEEKKVASEAQAVPKRTRNAPIAEAATAPRPIPGDTSKGCAALCALDVRPLPLLTYRNWGEGEDCACGDKADAANPFGNWTTALEETDTFCRTLCAAGWEGDLPFLNVPVPGVPMRRVYSECRPCGGANDGGALRRSVIRRGSDRVEVLGVQIWDDECKAFVFEVPQHRNSAAFLDMSYPDGTNLALPRTEPESDVNEPREGCQRMVKDILRGGHRRPIVEQHIDLVLKDVLGRVEYKVPEYEPLAGSVTRVTLKQSARNIKECKEDVDSCVRLVPRGAEDNRLECLKSLFDGAENLSIEIS